VSAFTATPFQPRPWLSNGHAQTIAGNFLRRVDHLPPPAAELIEVEPATPTQMASQVLCHCHWQPEDVRAERLTVIVLHGLEGSSESQYVVGNANKMWRAGYNVIRMNMRNCGGTEALSPTLYHSGLSGDIHAVLKTLADRIGLRQFALCGYSMGGNLVLKLAGELGASEPRLFAVTTVSPALDLAESAQALHAPINRLYELRFLGGLCKRYRRKAKLFPRFYDPARADRLRSLIEFDDRITAPYSGFEDAADYYFRAAAARVLADIAVPTLILNAMDDPFVRITPASRAEIRRNPHITLIDNAHGGHCAFLAKAVPAEQDDGYWAETTVLRFLQGVLPDGPGPSAGRELRLPRN
jgi:predicted alpha/beta-fold hydrolase